MVKIRSVALIQAINITQVVEVYYLGQGMVSLTLSFSLHDKVEAIVKWGDMWNCLFLSRGKEKIFRRTNLKANLRRVRHLHQNDQIALYFEPFDENSVILIKWKDLREALLIIKRSWMRDFVST